MAEHNIGNDITFDCKRFPPGEVIQYVFRITGRSLHFTFLSFPIKYNFVLFGHAIKGTVGRSLALIRYDYSLSGEGVIEHTRLNWVGWSKIGESSFVLDVTNDAGFRPMEWSGQVYAIKQLGRGAVVYGDNGITLMAPAQATFSFKNLALIGLLAKDAVCGTDELHYLIDKKYQLWKLTVEGLTFLDFSEFLSVLVQPTLHYDPFTKHVLISDADHGFILAADKLGSGYAKLSGYVYESGVLRCASPQLVEYAPLSFTTDILDFGRRSQKTITNVQVGTDVPEWLEISYDYRFDLKEDFRCTRWVRLNKEATAYLACAGIEFRIKVRARRIAKLDIDYLNVSFKTTDQRFSRSAYVPNLARSAFAGSVTSESSVRSRPNQ